jgi:hypothetical protein
MRRSLSKVAISGAVVAVVLLMLVMLYEPIEEGRCRLYRRKADPESQSMELAAQLLLPLDSKPENLQDIPAGFDRPCYYEIKIGNKRIPMVLNLSERPTLCMDTDGDGLLSKEQIFTARHIDKKNSNIWRFSPTVSIRLNSSGNLENSFCINCFRVDEPGLLTVFPIFYHTGKLSLDSKVYRVAAADGDCDGQLNSILSLPLDRPWRFPASDVFAIDLNGNGKFELSLIAQSEVMPLGKLVKVANEYYTVKITPDGRNLELSRNEPQFGTLAIDSNNADVELKLWSDVTDQYISQEHQWKLPAGMYKAVYAKLVKSDTSGKDWTLSSTLASAFTNLGALEFFTIKPGETTTIKIGPPFVAKADVQQTGPRKVSIGAILFGCSGEEYPAAFIESQRQRSSPPTFKIVDEKGTVLVSDKFQYG